ncbi:jg6091 [Pararge aegeria aegeria]|uniref:Jg6091 protein n=1 Tax=Pararge aegeria aegeria TaxID=348720 RepID=A0A8S4S832_9NEOP|nr:jg6091 [Pararge aegeria aegeria]
MNYNDGHEFEGPTAHDGPDGRPAKAAPVILRGPIGSYVDRSRRLNGKGSPFSPLLAPGGWATSEQFYKSQLDSKTIQLCVYSKFVINRLRRQSE